MRISSMRSVVLAPFVAYAISILPLCEQTTALSSELDREVQQAPVWDCADANPKYVAWRTPIGRHGGPLAMYKDKLLIGTDNDQPRDRAVMGDHGVMMCTLAKSGKFLWQKTHSRLGRRDSDWPTTPIRSRPCFDDGRVYYVSNRGELMCLDLDNGKQLWKLDVVEDLKVYKRDAGEGLNPISSPVVFEDLVYCLTGNGGDSSEIGHVPRPDAPSFIAANKETGKLVWSSSAPGKGIIYGQWSSPVVARVDGKARIIFPGGDGWLYGCQPKTGEILWKVDCNEPHAKPWGPRSLGTRQFFVATPVVHEEILYVGVGAGYELQDLFQSPLYAVDLRGKGDMSKTAIKWRFNDKAFGGTFASVAIKDRIVYTLGERGVLYALDLEKGTEIWSANLDSANSSFASPFVHENKLFVPTDTLIYVFEAGDKNKPLGRYDLNTIVQGQPIVHDGRLYASGGGYLWALRLVD